MKDLADNKVEFPGYTSLRKVLRSTITGDIIPAVERADGYTLAEEIVDMTMLHPVNFDRVVAGVKTDLIAARSLTDEAPALSFVNLGPGNVLWRGTARALPEARLSMIDWSSASRPEPVPKPVPAKPAKRDAAVGREPIAIVGMAVKLPGAVDAAGLWEVLEKGLNTVSEVCPSSLGMIFC